MEKIQDEIMQFRINQRKNKIDIQTVNKKVWDEDKIYFTQNLEKREEEDGYPLARKWISEHTKKQGGNKKNKPVIYKKKIILGKERSVYKISGSRKDYIKYKGNLVTVRDFIASKR